MLMTRNEILEKLKEILVSADERNRDRLNDVTEAANLYTDLGLSSVNMLYMVIAIEELFNIRFDNIGINEFQTVGDVVGYIEEKLS